MNRWRHGANRPSHPTPGRPAGAPRPTGQLPRSPGDAWHSLHCSPWPERRALLLDPEARWAQPDGGGSGTGCQVPRHRRGPRARLAVGLCGALPHRVRARVRAAHLGPVSRSRWPGSPIRLLATAGAGGGAVTAWALRRRAGMRAHSRKERYCGANHQLYGFRSQRPTGQETHKRRL